MFPHSGGGGGKPKRQRAYSTPPWKDADIWGESLDKPRERGPGLGQPSYPLGPLRALSHRTG